MKCTTTFRILWVEWCIFWSLLWLSLAISSGIKATDDATYLFTLFLIDLPLSVMSLFAILIPIGRKKEVVNGV